MYVYTPFMSYNATGKRNRFPTLNSIHNMYVCVVKVYAHMCSKGICAYVYTPFSPQESATGSPLWIVCVVKVYVRMCSKGICTYVYSILAAGKRNRFPTLNSMCSKGTCMYVW